MMLKTHTAFIENNLPNLPSYSDIKQLSGLDLHYRGIYELFLRNERNIDAIYFCIKAFVRYRAQIRETKISFNEFNDEIKETVYIDKNNGTWEELEKSLRRLALPIKHYDESHIYLNRRMNKKIFPIINYVFNRYQELLVKDNQISIFMTELNMQVTLKKYLYDSSSEKNPYSRLSLKDYEMYKLEIMKETQINGIIYTEVVTVKFPFGFSLDESIELFHEVTEKKLSLQLFLLKNKKEYTTETTIKFDDTIYPIINQVNNNNLIFNMKENLLKSKDTKKITKNLISQSGIFETLSEEIKHKENEAFLKLENILKDPKKLVNFLYIYDSHKLFYKSIKVNLEKTIKEKGSSINKVQILSLRLAISNKIKYSTGNIKNYSSLINSIVNDELYLLM